MLLQVDHSTYCMQFLISQCLLLQGGLQRLLHAVPHQSVLLVAGWTTAPTACSSSSVSTCCCRVDHNTYSMQFLIDQFKLKEKQRKECKRKGGSPGDSDSAIASEADSEEGLDKIVTMDMDSDSEEDITELF